MVPIMLGIASSTTIAKTELLFSEQDIISSNYLKSVMASISSEHAFNISSDQFIKCKFDELYKKWSNNTMFYSNPKMIIEDENFQSILNLGEQAVPLILNKIEEEPSQLVWALNIITEKQMSNNSMISISDSCKRWVKYGKQNII
jgi:hypothetical protein